jgi:hypothetical protein
MKASLIQFPWKKVERGQGFFVPCLDTQAVRELGLKKAVLLRIMDARAITGIHSGFTGVLFYRLPRALSPHT